MKNVLREKNLRDGFAKINSREIFQDRKFAKINSPRSRNMQYFTNVSTLVESFSKND